MKIFISWSGPVSQQIAGELRKWLPLVLQGIDPFITSSDIDKGAKWQGEILKELDECNFGIVCLTPQNLASQWIAFEAGALSKHLEGRVATLLFNLTPTSVSFPLAMFQATRFESSDLRKLVGDINKQLPENLQRSTEQLDKMFDTFWPELEQSVGLVLQNADAAPIQPEPSALEVMAQEMMSMLRQQNALLSNPEALFAPAIRAALERDRVAADFFSRVTGNTLLEPRRIRRAVRLFSEADAEEPQIGSEGPVTKER